MGSFGYLSGKGFLHRLKFLILFNLWSCICRYNVNTDTDDSWSWIGKKDGKFSTKDMYKVLSVVMLSGDVDHFSWKKLCWKAVPSKVRTFSWKVVRVLSKKIC